MENKSVQQIVKEKQLKGLGGWLILVAVGLLLAVPDKFNSIITGIDAIKSYTLESTLIKVLIYGELVVNIVLLVINVILLYLFFSKKKSFVKTWLILLQINLYTIALFDLALLFIDDIDTGLPAFFNTFMAGIALLIWGSYATKSIRVKNTFVN
ncbi:DUF2569 family protein [Bacillus sp. NEB1478]|uniref:DUF2569 family protein n=1 Tax=Bacillus sp. NEB1478 TaxID=3073816 RepID=UPI002872DF58|nr:DUF2569 family protein [Bacillus sp. NEB1478]WNB92445.1 DUF2569 family protein [Bacillus sp. NEB1478]